MPSTPSSLDSIACPTCGELIAITETLHHQLTESVRQEYEDKLAAQEQSISEQKAEITVRTKALDDKERGIEERVQATLASELEKQKAAVAKTARAEAEKALAVELQDLRDTVQTNEAKLKEARQTELTLRKRERELEERAKDIELEVARKMDDERTRVEEETARRITDEYRMKEAEKDKKISDMMQQIEVLKLKAEQGSQQTQGEVQELELEKELAALFPFDTIQPVPKDMRGADVIQDVIDNRGNRCGAIIWESKRTQSWSDGWIAKLKEDQRAARADVAILVTQALPKDIRTFGDIDGVWVTNYVCFYSLAVAMRQKIIELASTRSMAAGKNEKADIIFHYLTGVEFRQRVEAIVGAFSDMKSDFVTKLSL
jgi:hypothetical protein